MTVVEIIIAELHCLSNGGHRVDCSASYVRDGRGALSETVATASLRTKRMLSMFRLRNKKCSETGPNRRCSGPEQYQKQFRFDLYCLSMSVFLLGYHTLLAYSTEISLMVYTGLQSNFEKCEQNSF